jgi:mRNA-degrading endonuclease RelE of RelBE toxin-antitoxin system
VDQFRVTLTPAAQRQLDRLRGPAFVTMRGVILALADDPRPVTPGRLVGTADLWRVRVRIDGTPWRVIYQLRNDERLVLITRVARRDESTYRGLGR